MWHPPRIDEEPRKISHKTPNRWASTHPVFPEVFHGRCARFLQVVEFRLCDLLLLHHPIANLHGAVSVRGLSLHLSQAKLPQKDTTLLIVPHQARHPKVANWLMNSFEHQKKSHKFPATPETRGLTSSTCVTMLPSSNARTVAGRHKPSGVKI